jgi:hypothetical protein
LTEFQIASNSPVPHHWKKSPNKASVPAPNFSRNEGEPWSTRFGKASSSGLITPAEKQSSNYGNSVEFNLKVNFHRKHNRKLYNYLTRFSALK